MTWDDFFGRKVWTIKTLMDSVRQAGVKSTTEYRVLAPKKGWPGNDTLRNMLRDGGVTLDEFFGRE